MWRQSISLEDVDHFTKLLEYVCKEMSGKAKFRDHFGIVAQLIAAVNWTSKVGIHYLGICWVVGTKFL